MREKKNQDVTSLNLLDISEHWAWKLDLDPEIRGTHETWHLENKNFDPGDLPVEAVDVVVGLDEELVGEVRLVGVDDDRFGEVLEDLDDGVVVLAIPTLLLLKAHVALSKESGHRLRESRV